MEQDGPAHDAFLLGDMEAACDRIEQAIAAGERICVHGDYDVDGICATALAVQVLEELGAHVEWHLPSRFEEGYGVGVQALERVAASGVRLLLTVDCGITAVTEVERARELGMDVIITDHHRPGPALPDALRVATRPSDYPFPELCGSGVVFKLAEALHASRRPRSGRPRAAPRPGRPGHRRRRRPAARREPPARPRRAAPARPHDASRPAGADGRCPGRPYADRRRRPRLPARPADQRRRPAGPPRRRPGAAADGRRGPGPGTRGQAGDAEPPSAAGRERDPGRRGRPGRGRRRRVALPPRVRARLVRVARGRDRHRRLAAGRAIRPPGGADRHRRRRGEGLRPQHPGVRPARRAWPRRAEHLLRFGGHRAAAGPVDRPGRDRRLLRRAGTACRRDTDGRRPAPRRCGSTPCSRPARSRSTWSTSWPGSSRSGWATPA